MRTVGLLVSITMLLASGCKNSGEASSTADPAAVKAQQELVARRDALLSQRTRLQAKASELEVEISKKSASGEDVSELAKQKAEVENQIKQQDTNLDTMSTELSAISTKLDAAGGLAMREARVAEREARVAEREKSAMNQMQRLIDQESKNAEKWKEGCVGGGTTTVIQQVAPPKGGTYTRKEVDALFGRAKGAMAKKNLLQSDLGAQGSLEGEITKALGDQDWTRGYILASQLAQTIDAIQINRPFIKAKYDRLAARARSTKLDESTQSALEQGMKEVMQRYGDGDFASANKRINQLYGQLR